MSSELIFGDGSSNVENIKLDRFETQDMQTTNKNEFCRLFKSLNNVECKMLFLKGNSRLIDLNWLVSVGLVANSVKEIYAYAWYSNWDSCSGSLSGVSNFVNITVLSDYNNGVNDLSELNNLKKLNYLNLKSNLISDLSPLERFN